MLGLLPINLNSDVHCFNNGIVHISSCVNVHTPSADLSIMNEVDLIPMCMLHAGNGNLAAMVSGRCDIQSLLDNRSNDPLCIIDYKCNYETDVNEVILALFCRLVTRLCIVGTSN